MRRVTDVLRMGLPTVMCALVFATPVGAAEPAGTPEAAEACPALREKREVQERALVGASLMAYLLPLVSLILGAVAAQEAALYWGWSSAELGSIAGGLLGLIIGLDLLRRFAIRSRRNPDYQAVILRRDIGEPVRLDLN